MSSLPAACSIAELTAAMQAASLSAPQSAPLVRAPLFAPFLMGLTVEPINQKEACQIVQLICQVARQAIKELKSGNLLAFDALVSDCACQIRAIHIVRIAQQVATCPALQKEMDALEVTLDSKRKALQKQSADMGTTKDKVAIKALLLSEEIEVPKELLILAKAYLLAKTKHLDVDKVTKAIRDRTEYSKLDSLQKGLSASSRKSIVDTTKVALSRAGVQFLQEAGVVQELSIAVNLRVIYERAELPCIFTLQALFRLTQQHMIPILLRVRRASSLLEKQNEPCDVKLLFRPEDTLLQEQALGTALPLIQEYLQDPLQPMVVIEGQRSGQGTQAESEHAYRTRLEAFPLLDILEMNAATHKQYSDGKALQDLTFQNAGERARLEQQAVHALNLGACFTDQRLFCITHIFADTAKNHFGIVKKSK